MSLPHLGHDSRTDNEGLPHVPNPEEEAEVPVPQTDAGLTGKHYGVGPLFGPRQLGKHHAHHERLQDDARDALKAHHQHSLWTLLCGVPVRKRGS